MKNLLKLLSIFLILFISLSCEKKQDWTCVCSTVITPDLETFIIEDVRGEEEAKELCNAEDWDILGMPGTGMDCELVE